MTGTFNLLSKTAYDIRLSGAFQSNLRTAISGTGVLETFQTYRYCTKSVNPSNPQNSHSFIHKPGNFCQTREALDLFLKGATRADSNMRPSPGGNARFTARAEAKV